MNTDISCYCPVAAEAESVKQYHLTVLDSIDKVNEYQWNNNLPQANALMAYDYLKLIETSQQGQMGFRYIQVRKDEATVGVIYFQVVRFESAQLMNYFPKGDSVLLSTMRGVSSAVLNRLNVNMLVSGNIFMTGENGFYFNHTIDVPTRGKLLRLAINRVLKEDRSIKAVLLSDLYEPKSVFDEGFKACGYHEITVESDMGIQLQPEWRTFDDYLNALSSKYRVRARKVFALCAENNVVCKDLNADEVAAAEDELYRLYRNVMDGVEFKLGALQKNYFRLQKLQMPNNYKVYAYYHNGVMIGFISAFILGNKVEVHYTGMDHDACKPIHLYQHMMYDMVKLGIESRVQRLHFGRTAPEIKSTIGAAPSPMYGYLKHCNPLFNTLLVRPYTARLKPKQYVIRNPFK